MLKGFGRCPYAVCLVIFLLCLPLTSLAAGTQDLANSLTVSERDRLEAIVSSTAERAGTPLLVVTVPDMSSASTTTRLNELVLQLSRHPDNADAMILVWAADQNNIYISFGEGWSNEQMERTLIRATQAFASFKGQAGSQAGLIPVARTLQTQALVRSSLWYRYLDDQGHALQGFYASLKRPGSSFYLSAVTLSVLIFFLLEKIIPWRKQQAHRRQQIGLDLFYTFVHKPLFFALIGAGIVSISDFSFQNWLRWQFGVENLVAIQLGSLPHWLQLVLFFLISDFLGYWAHRTLHCFDFLWRFHKVHHSAAQLDIFNSIRQHFAEELFYRTFRYIPMGMLGFSLGDALLVVYLQTLIAFYPHANLNLPMGPLRYLLNNPQLHIWHHASESPRPHGVNFGAALSCWDYLFGTAWQPQQGNRQFDGSDLKLGFEGSQNYPRGFLGQLCKPFEEQWRHLRVAASALSKKMNRSQTPIS